MPLRYLLRIDWDVIAGIIAALVAMLLSFMGLVSETVGRGIILLLCALLLIRDLRGEAREHRMFDKLDVIRRYVAGLAAAKQANMMLIGPKAMRQELRDFSTTICGEARWYNACCRMFRRQEIFDATLRPLLDNPNVTAIHLMCRPEERRSWLADLLPKLQRCDHGGKVRPPLWGPIRSHASFLLGDVDGDGRAEALLSIAGEPFSTSNPGPAVPRFLLRILGDSDLVAPLEEMVRQAATEFASDAEGDAGFDENRPSVPPEGPAPTAGGS